MKSTSLTLIRKACGVLFSASVVLLVSGCEEEGPTSQPGLEGATHGDAEAVGLEGEGRWMEAAALYERRALEGRPPANAASMRQALSAYFMAERPDEAARLAAEVRSRWPEFHEVLLYVADLQRVTMRHEEARRTIESFLAKEPEHAQGNLVSGLILVALGDTESGLRAIEAFLRHTGVEPAHRREAEVVRVRALRRLGRYREAADAITEVLESRPLDPVALADAAQTYALAGNEILADAASQQHAWLSRRGHRLPIEDPGALQRPGPRPEGRARLALQARDRREFLAAIEELRALIAEDPDGSELTYLLGQLWLRLGRFRECRQVLEAFETRAEPDPDLLHLRALLFERQGMAREAAAEWRRAVEAIDSREASGRESSGVEQPAIILLAAADQLLETGGDLERASRWYAAAGRSAATPRPLVGEARIAIRRGELDRAQELLTQLGTWVDPETSDDYLRLEATIRGLRGDLSFAARQLTPMIVKDPSRDENFAAFLQVFGDKRGVPEVERIEQLRDEWSAKRRAVQDVTRRLSARRFEDCAGEYHRLGLLAMDLQDGEGALDAFMMAAELDLQATESLKAALKVLRKPSDIFERLHSMRRILERDRDDPEILELLARTYVHVGVRRDEAERIAGTLHELRPDPASERLLEDARGE